MADEDVASGPKDAFRREVARRLKEARRERSLTQRQLADLGHSTQQNISRYEKGFIPDSWYLLARLHAEKAIDLNWLLSPPPPAPAETPVPGAAQPARISKTVEPVAGGLVGELQRVPGSRAGGEAAPAPPHSLAASAVVAEVQR